MLQLFAELMDGADTGGGDIKAFQTFALKIDSLVGVLKLPGMKGVGELKRGSQVSRALRKLPLDLMPSFLSTS